MNATSQLFKALGEPVRLRILVLLLNGERCVCDLMAVLDLPQSTISRHLAYLKNAGWVEGERRGTWMYYRLAHMQDDFRDRLLEALAKQLPKTAQGAGDLQGLQRYLTRKGKNDCR